MIKITLRNDKRLDLHISGKIDSESMKSSLDEYILKSEGIENGVMLYTIDDIDMPSLGAIGAKLSMLPKLMSRLHNFDRVAIAANQEWIKKLSELESLLIPGIQIKAFDRDSIEAAEAWLESENAAV